MNHPNFRFFKSNFQLFYSGFLKNDTKFNLQKMSFPASQASIKPIGNNFKFI